MNVNGDPGTPEVKDAYEIGPLTYRQGYVMVWADEHGCRDEALMHDRVIVAAYTGTPEKKGDQLFRAWVDANELPSTLAHWATVLG
ncbi:hypothetical protein [Streptomyces sp. Isolate_45]|uniref:hypothetical protein n=1 Tax=Streptomyces sp. Isolate_45 TaxID=2950111 RepID=UPI002481A52B|nr:hypothetical protein [Streptomyces sp. Isolate_45]MDA5286411.1 hypothetical protein [Streptomyces sp. Isolate_45]